MSTIETALLALDWGTSSLRVLRLAPGGEVLEARHLPRGIMHVSPAATEDRPAAFERAFEEACGDWLEAWPTTPVIACGMIGSAQGWHDAPYLEVPTAFDRIASSLTRVQTRRGTAVHIVPGLIERGRLPNVMRGEETQILGALAEPPPELGAEATTLIGLPGTHSKWAQVQKRRLVHFETFMTGEVYEALCEHTLLGRTLKRTSSWDVAAFDRGARVAHSPEGRAGVLSTIFSTRTLGLVGSLAPEAQADYLSGLLIGHEIQALEDLDRHAFGGAARVVLAGAAGLCERYQRVIEGRHPSARVVIARRATERGLWALACATGLVRASQDGARPLRRALQECGLVAILRGIRPHEAAGIGAALYTAGFRAIEVPLNSPEPLESIRRLREALAPDCAIGAGTVLTAAEVDAVRDAGGAFIVMPHTDARVIRAAKAAGLEAAPGCATITEALAALGAGADVLKMFPGDQLGPGTLAAWRAVLPPHAAVIPVGGITTSNLAAFVASGAVGVGLGSALYRPGSSASDVAESASAFVDAWRSAKGRSLQRGAP